MFTMPNIEELEDDVVYYVEYLTSPGWMGYLGKGREGVLAGLPKIVYDRVFQYSAYRDVLIFEEEADKEILNIRRIIKEASSRADWVRHLLEGEEDEEKIARLGREVVARELQKDWWTDRLNDVRYRREWTKKLTDVAEAHKRGVVDVSVVVDPEALGVGTEQGDTLTLGEALYYYLSERSAAIPDEIVSVMKH